MILRGGSRSCKAIINICLLFFLAILPTAAFGAHFPPPASTDTPNAVVYYISLKIDGVAAKPGDEVAFFDPQGILCGSFVVGSYPDFPVQVYGDDNTSHDDEGATAGDILTVKVWQASSGLEFSGNQLVLSPGYFPESSALPSAIPPIWGQDGNRYILNIDTSTHFPLPTTTTRIGNYIGSLSIKGKPAEIGDEVAAYDVSGVLRGLVRVTKPGYYGNMAVYGDESTVAGAELTFKVWDRKAGIEYSGTALTLRPGTAMGSYLPSLIPPVWQENVGYILNIDVLAVSSGDVDGNGRVDIADAILALQICAGFPTADARLSSDVSGDMKLGLQEVIYILQKTGQLR